MAAFWHIHSDWSLVRTTEPMVHDSTLDEDCRRTDLSFSEAVEYRLDPKKFAIENDLTETDGGLHDHRKDIDMAVLAASLELIQKSGCYVSVEPVPCFNHQNTKGDDQ